ncbi:MAG: GreA/GreB family elongation factor [Verrucomicrobia bacterium]|nr:GreA/GreB family elongation factor [Verrucomicrobiota bacterium]
MGEKIILSTVSAWALGSRFDDTVAQKNAALREAKVAKLDGDLSENAPYQAAKEKFRTMGRIQRRLTREMNELIAQGHTLVDPLTWAAPGETGETAAGVATVVLGTVVTVDWSGTKDSFLVAGARDHHLPDEGDLVPIPYNSPLGKALAGRSAGERFTTEINGQRRDITIVSVRRPTRDEILRIFPSLRQEEGV